MYWPLPKSLTPVTAVSWKCWGGARVPLPCWSPRFCLGWSAFGQMEYTQLPAVALKSCFFAKDLGVLAVWSSLRSSYCTMPRIWCLVQQRGGSWIAFPSWTNQALLLLFHKCLVGLTWVSSFPKRQLFAFHRPLHHHLKHLFGYVNQIFW